MKIKTLTLFAFFFLCISFCSWGQENKALDSLIHQLSLQNNDTLKVFTLEDITYRYLYIDVDKSLKYSEEGLRLSNDLNFEYGKGLSKLGKGTAYAVKGQQDSAMFYWNTALTTFKKLKKYGVIGRTNRNLAIMSYETGNYETALGHIQESIEIFTEKVEDSLSLANSLDTNSKIRIFQGNYKLALKPALSSLRILEKLNEPSWLAHALNNIAIIEFYNDNFQKSIEYNERAVKIYKKYDDKWWIAQVLNDIGNSYYYLEDYEKAQTVLNECLSISREVENIHVLGTALNNVGKTLIKKKEIDKAISTLNESLEIAEEMDSKNKIAERLNDLGNAYFEKGDLTKSIELYTKAIAIGDSIGAKNNLRNGYHFRSKAYARANNFKMAYLDNENLRIVNDSIFNKTKSQQIEELKTIYETEKKEQQIVLQKKEIVVLEQEARISDQQKLLLGGGLGLSLLIVGFGFYGFRQKSKRNQLEKDKVEAELAFKKKELTTHALHLAKKNEVLENVKLKAKDLKLQGDTKGYQDLIKTINFDQQDDKNWESFTQYFEQVHKDFAKNVKNRYPEVTKNELRFMALLKMNMSSKEIATILNISLDGIKKARQRLRKKMGLTPDDSLENTVLAI